MNEVCLLTANCQFILLVVVTLSILWHGWSYVNMAALVRGDVERKKRFYRKLIRVSGHSFECKAFLISKKLLRSPLNSTMADLHFFVCVFAVAECLSACLYYYTKWRPSCHNGNTHELRSNKIKGPRKTLPFYSALLNLSFWKLIALGCLPLFSLFSP